MAIVAKLRQEDDGDNLIPISDSKTKITATPLIVVNYDLGNDIRKALQSSKEKVLLSVDFDAVIFDPLTSD